MLNGTPFILRLCDHRGECLEVDHDLRIDGRVVEIAVHKLDGLMEALSDTEFALFMDSDDEGD